MSEQLNGFQQMAANAEAHIATTEANAAAAMVADEAQARVMDQQIDKSRAIEERRNSPEVQAMNEAADIAVFGSRGRTAGYVDTAGNPITSPIEGKVDQIRDQAGVADMRTNPRYGTIKNDREAKADSRATENNRRAEAYVGNIEALRAGGFELTQAKLILDLREERIAKNRSVHNKLLSQYAGTMSPSEASDAAAARVMNLELQQGNDEALTQRIIRQEGLFDRNEYNRFRFKRGNAKNGERKEFTAYREQNIAANKAQDDAAERAGIEATLAQKELAREQVRDAEREGWGEAPTLVHVPIDDPSPKGLRNRVRALMAKAGAFTSVKLANMTEYFTDDEEGKRRKIVAGVAGTVITAGLVYLDVKGGGVSHHVVEQTPKGSGQGSHELQSTINGSTDPMSFSAKPPAPEHVSQVAHHAHQAAHEASQQVNLSLGHQGDTIEGEVAKQLHMNLKDPHVTKVTEAVLHNQGISWDEARHLPVGYSFNMPPQHVIEELLKNNQAS